MTENIALQPTSRFNFARIVEVLLQPQRTFSLIAGEARPSWLTPMLTLSASTVLSVIVSGYLTSRAAMMGEVQLPRDWQWWTPEMQSNYMAAQQSMQGPVFAYIIPLVSALIGLWLGWLILSGLLHLGSTLLGGRGSMQGALNITGWGSLPFLVRDALRIVFMLIAGHAISSPGLSGFAGSAAFVGQVLARVDVFFLWVCVLLVIGFSAGDSLPKTKAVTSVVVVTLLLLLAQAGIGAMLSNASGLVVQRPFF
ncbi:MAG: YIP1 family protein [Chloroflexi bacterium]|nr:YIP1 family protein [Chloroflexota bacterium]